MKPLVLMMALWAASAGKPGKLPESVAKEMAEAVEAANKALGLESWPTHGVAPCVDRGGEGSLAKDVTADDTRRCVDSAIAGKFAAMGKSYVLAVLMSDIGPTTVFALGKEEAAGWGAYSCDPGKKCRPTKVDTSSKWGKRMVERRTKACASPKTVWFPSGQKVCD